MVSVSRIDALVIVQPQRRPPRTGLSRPRLPRLASSASIRASRGTFCLRLKREEQADGDGQEQDDDGGK